MRRTDDEMKEKHKQKKTPNHIEVRTMHAPKVQKMKARYIQDAKERLPKYFSPEKRMFTENLSMEELKKVGLPKEIFWKMVEYNLSAKDGMSANRLSEIAIYIDFLASEYVVYAERVHRDFEGDELKEQVGILDEVFKRSFERMMNIYTQYVGKFLERNDFPNESEVIKQSISELYLRKIHQYAEFIRLEPDYAMIEGTEDQWLLRDSYFMGDVLRLIVSKLFEQCIMMPAELYNEADLCAAGAIFQSANTWLITQKATTVSEEQLGVDLGLLAMKFQVIAEQDELSPQFRKKLMPIFTSFYNYKIDDLNQRHKEAQENVYNRENDLYGELDEIVVEFWTRELHNYVLEKDIAGVFLEAIPKAFATFKQKVEFGSRLERYQLNNEWYQFYNESETVTHRHSNAFTYKLRVNEWNDFIEKVNLDLDWQYYAP